jgi:peptidoglycan hydrolase-like protein with peptidoglycan-binding domain
MPSIPSSLLIIVSLLVPCASLYGDEQIRKAQEELRKRHLFYGETTGQPSPALSAAIVHYQKKKGFSCTGYLDPETSASLGLIKVTTTPAETPFVVADTGDLRGANGEALPTFLVFHPPGEGPTRFELAGTEHQQIARSLAPNETALVARQQRPSDGRPHRPRHRAEPRKETNPLVLAFQSVNHAMQAIVGDPSAKRKPAKGKRL